MVVDREYYDILEVEPSATHEEIRKAYRRKALKCHPDTNRGNPYAEEQFKELNHAYEILNDREKRQIYDQVGKEGLESNNGMPSMNPFDFMSHIFGGMNRQRGNMYKRRVNIELTLSLEDLFNLKYIDHSTILKEHCTNCHKKCHTCNGSGMQFVVRNMGLMTLQQQIPCQDCQGTGKQSNIDTSCTRCQGKGEIEHPKTLHIPINPDLETGNIIEMIEEDTQYLLHVQISKHKHFTRNGKDLIYSHTLNLKDALFGTCFDIQLLNCESFTITTNGMTQPESQIIYEGKGLPDGNLIVQYHVDLELNDSIKSKIKDIFENVSL